MQQGLKGSIAGVVAAATLLAGGILTVPHAMALEADGQYYSSKQPYVAPSEATTASYSQAPEGYETVYTESMARHGSRGLSSYKYDALLMKMAEAAEADNGFKSDAIKSEFMKNLKAITAANVENGYGMLTGQGADQHQGIGARAYERNKTLFDNAAKDGGKIAYQSSGEARATESGENFARGFNAASNNKLANSTVTPADPAGTGEAAAFDKTPNTLYFHKSENPDGTEKTGEAKQRADDYQNFVENDAIIAGAEQTIAENEDVKTASHDLLSQIFTDDFLAKLADGTYAWTTLSMAPRAARPTARREPTPARMPTPAAQPRRRSPPNTMPRWICTTCTSSPLIWRTRTPAAIPSTSTSTSKVSRQTTPSCSPGRLTPRTSTRRARATPAKTRPTQSHSRCLTISSRRLMSA